MGEAPKVAAPLQFPSLYNEEANSCFAGLLLCFRAATPRVILHDVQALNCREN